MSISQKFVIYDDPSQMEPLMPGEHCLGALLEQAGDLIRSAERLGGQCQAGALNDLRGLLRAMNSYHSNRIEGQHTLPIEIEQALKSDYSDNADKARRQRLALAHMDTEAAFEARVSAITTGEIWSSQFVQDIHRDLFSRLRPSDWQLDGGDPSLPAGSSPSALIPGELRSQHVSVGRHAAPAPSAIPACLARWSEFHRHVRRGEMQVLAALAAHHRLTWIHPFRDGNGRVARLHTHLALGQMGLTHGLWSPLRGFARTHEGYYAHLAGADEHRAGDLDGRGNLSQAGLLAWIGYALNICTDQVSFMSSTLDLARIKDRIAACLSYEASVVAQGVRTESVRALHYLFATQSSLERADFKALLGLGDRLASAQVSALLKRGLIASDSPYGKLRFGVPQHALRFYFPGLWPEAEAG